MTTRALLIGARERVAIRDLIARAAANPTPIAVMKRGHAFRAKVGPVYSDLNEAATIIIPMGYSVTYTHEEQPRTICRHISIGVLDARPGAGPGIQAVAILMDEFKFKNPLGVAYTYAEIMPDEAVVVNVIEPLDGDMSLILKPMEDSDGRDG